MNSGETFTNATVQGNLIVEGLSTFAAFITTGLSMLGGSIVPAVTGTYDLGTWLLYYSNAFVNNLYVNYLKPNGVNTDIYSTANLDPVTDNTLSLGNSSKGWGEAFINSLASTTSSTVSLLASIVPGTDNTYGIGTGSKRLSTIYTNVMACSNLNVSSNIGSNLIPNTGGGSFNLGNSGNPWVSAYITAFGAPTQGYAAVMARYTTATFVPGTTVQTAIPFTSSCPSSIGSTFLTYSAGTFTNNTGKTIDVLIGYNLACIVNYSVYQVVTTATPYSSWGTILGACYANSVGQGYAQSTCVLSLTSTDSFTICINASGTTAGVAAGANMFAILL